MDYAQAFAQLVRLLPYPAPMGGIHGARYMTGAYMLSGAHAQREAAQAQLRLGYRLQRTDAAPNDWSTTPSTWRFAPVADGTGASGAFLDAWGDAMGTRRDTGEADAAYGPRILRAVVSPRTTAAGMAAMLDAGQGVAGTQVVDTWTFVASFRVGAGRRRNGGHRKGTSSLVDPDQAAFVVIHPAALSPTSLAAIAYQTRALRAAGVRFAGAFHKWM